LTSEGTIAHTTPLVLDLNGDGIHTVAMQNGVVFDLNDTGTAVQTGWVGSGDGLLALDLDGDGLIESGAELFGSATRLADGSRATDGFQALSALDSSGDGLIDTSDTLFAQLQVWQDSNRDGVSQSEELRSLTDLGIQSLNLNAETTFVLDEGNWIGLESNYTTADGQSHALVDVWFEYQNLPVNNTPTADEAVNPPQVIHTVIH